MNTGISSRWASFVALVILIVSAGCSSTPVTTSPATQTSEILSLATASSTASPTDTAAPSPTAAVQQARVVYTPSDEDFANPERGFMKQSSVFPDDPFDPEKVRALDPADSLVWIYFRLDNYRDRPLDAAGLATIQSVFDAARSRGLKLVIRFVYNPGPGSTTDPNTANPDVPRELALQHIEQLKPLLQANADVIAVLQAGFVGHWGEWHSSKYLHALEDRQGILNALLNALPADRMIQLRYPRYKEIFFGGPLGADTAFSGTDQSRIGHHNDCFLRGDDDGGTYRSVTAQEPKQESAFCDGKDAISCWKDFVADDGQFTVVGGETCQFNPPRTDCPNALEELAILHWSFLNNGYRREVLDGWTAGGCMDTIRLSLGYRFVLEEASIPEKVTTGGTLSVSIRLRNEGFAAIYNPRPVLLVLTGEAGRYEIPVPELDPRHWAPGEEHAMDIDVPLPTDLAPGFYQLGLWLPDAYDSLRDNPAYAVRFANEDVWDGTTGINVLYRELQVTE